MHEIPFIRAIEQIFILYNFVHILRKLYNMKIIEAIICGKYKGRFPLWPRVMNIKLQGPLKQLIQRLYAGNLTLDLVWLYAFKFGIKTQLAYPRAMLTYCACSPHVVPHMLHLPPPPLITTITAFSLYINYANAPLNQILFYILFMWALLHTKS